MSDTLNFFDPEYRQDPYPTLARLRASDPVHKSPFGWIVTRHADVSRLNRDPRLGRDTRKLRGGGLAARADGYPGLVEMLATWMFHLDAPDHTRIRKLVAHAFTPRAVEAMAASVERVVDTLLAAMPDEGEVEIIRALARPLPVTVICDLLQVPRDDYAAIERWSDAIAEQVEVTASPAQLAAASAAYLDFKAYLAGFVDERRRRPGSGLVDVLIAAEEASEALSSDELLANVILMLVAGHETTTHLIGNGLLALVRHPEQLEKVRHDPALAAPAVEECLRYESPTNTNGRVALEDLEIGGRSIKRGQLVLCMLGAANRDPEVFPDPDRFDVTRHPNPHQSFGGGPHFCIGAGLARQEGRIAFQRLFARYGTLELVAPPVWRDRINLRGLHELRLRVSRSARTRG